MSSTDDTEIAHRIKQRRIELNFTGSQVALAIGLKRENYAYLEKRCGPNALKLHLSNLSRALVASEEWITTGEGPPPPVVSAIEGTVMAGNQIPELRMRLGERARKRRKALGLKVNDVAAKIGVTSQRLYQMEACVLSLPDEPMESAWENCLGVPSGWLRRVNDPSPDFEPPSPADGSPGTQIVNYQPMDLRVKLAIRARQRRLDMGIKGKVCATALGVNYPNFGSYERVLRKFPDANVERLWELELGVPQGWLRDINMEAPPMVLPATSANTISAPISIEGCATVSDEIRAVAAWLSRKAILRRTTNLASLTDTERTWTEILAQRYGVGGEDGTTLESVGQRFGLTRERIRQMVKVMTDRAVDLKIATPRLEELAAQCATLAPTSVAEADKKLGALLGGSLSVESAQRFGAEILGRRVASISTVGHGRHLMTPAWIEDNAPVIKAARSAAYKMIRGAGAANIYYVCGIVSEMVGLPVTIDIVRTAVSFVPSFEWLIESEGWFWFGYGNGENRLNTTVKKIMAAADRKVDVDQIFLAFGRSSRDSYRGDDSQKFSVDAPIKVLQKVLERTPWLTCIQYNDFFANDEGELLGALSDVETEILKFIRENSGVAAKFEIDPKVCSVLGVTVVAVTTALSKSPCFVQPAKGLYSVCGCDLDPSALGRAVAAVETMANRGTNATADEDGNFTFKFELSEYHIKHKSIGLPNLLAQKLIPGPYTLPNQVKPALVSARESGLTVLSKMMDALNQMDAKAGTLLNLTINPVAQTVMFEIIED